MIRWGWLSVLTSGCLVQVVIPDGSSEEDTATVDPCAYATIDPILGGTLTLGDVSLVFPPGAVAAATDASLCPADAPAGYTPLSQVVTSSPVIELGAPITATLVNVGAGAAIYAPDATGALVRQLRVEGSGTVTATLYHPGLLFAAEDTRTEVDRTADDRADVLFVVDSSCSMADEQLRLGSGVATAFAELIGSGLDYHVGATSMDLTGTCGACQGRLNPYGGYDWVDPQTTDPLYTFTNMVSMGTSGSGIEEGVNAVGEALDPAVNPGFRRDGVEIAVVVVTDEPDTTARGAIKKAEFEAWFSDLMPYDQRWFDGIVDPGPQGAPYVDLISDLGGTLIDIGSSDWSEPLSDIFAALSTTAISLGAAPDLDTLEVWVVPADGGEPSLLVPPAYTYDPLANQVLVVPGPANPGDEIVVLYTPI